MKSTFSVIYYLKRQVVKKDGTVPVMGRITVDGSQTQFSCKLTVDPKLWDTKGGRVTGRSTAALEANRMLDKMRVRINRHYQEIMERDNFVTAEKVKNAFLGLEHRYHTLMQVFRQHNEDYEKQVEAGMKAKGTLEKYRIVYKHLQEFLDIRYHVKDIALKELTPAFISDFEMFLRTDKHCCTNTVWLYVCPLRTMVFIAINNEWLTRDPFREYEIKKEETTRSFLTKEEIRLLMDGKLKNEGTIFRPVAPYPVSYRALVPKREECTNLLVPVCLSASHVAYSSIRMEPNYMVLGQSAAVAVSQAIDEGKSVQEIDVTKLRRTLKENPYLDGSTPEILVDDTDIDKIARKGGWGALIIGALFALAFCPTGGVFYFGMLIPMSATATAGYLLPVVFAIATAIPVLVVAWILAFSVQQLGSFYGKMQKVQKGLASRRTGEPLRVMYDSGMPKDMLRRVMRKLKLSPYDTVVPGRRYHNHRDLMSFPDCGRSDLKYPERRPVDRLAGWRASMGSGSRTPGIFEIIAAADRFIHVPYHSFDAYLQLLREAAVSPKVKSIKISLYRLAKNSKVVEALIAAAHNGKRVTVVIELLARFDEESNIHWSGKMRDAGIEVIYGVEGLKVHGKLTHIRTTAGNYAVIGTGNFHEGNARSYTDVMLFTARPELVNDVERVFDFIASPFMPVKFRSLLVAPNYMRSTLSRLIRTEISNARKGLPAYIRMKINHITDEDMVELLYKASAAGVQVDIALRGNCSLVTGQEGVSENIRICGIIDRYLEHSRILIFANGGDYRIFIGAADWMPRNLDHRVEVLAPVYDPAIRDEMRRIVYSALADTVQARVVDGSGENRLRTPGDLPPFLRETFPGLDLRPFRSQDELYRHYSEE